MHFFGNTKLFCHFLLADIEKVLYIYMPFYDGMGTYFLEKWCSGVEKTIKNTVALLVSNLIVIYLQVLSGGYRQHGGI